MTVQMTVTISDLVYDRLKNLASVQQQPLSEVVERLLTVSLPTSEAESEELLSEADKVLKQEIAVFHRMHPLLWKKYPNQHVALYMGELIDHDPDGVALSLRIYQRFPGKTVLIRQVEAVAEREIRIRSPRVIRNNAKL